MVFFADWRRLGGDQMGEPWVVTYDAKNECSETCMCLISQLQVEARCIVRAFKQYMYIDTAHKKQMKLTEARHNFVWVAQCQTSNLGLIGGHSGHGADGDFEALHRCIGHASWCVSRLTVYINDVTQDLSAW